MSRHFVLASFLALSCSSDVAVKGNANIDPSVSINDPADGEEFTELDTIEFTGTLADGNGLDDIQTYRWSSDVDGVFSEDEDIGPNGAVRASSRLSAGTHSIVLEAFDTEGAFAQDTITLEIEPADEDPVAEIIDPTNLDIFEIQGEVVVVGSVFDPNDPLDALDAVWTVSPVDGSANPEEFGSGAPNGAGTVTAVWQPTGLGDWFIELVVTDPAGNDASSRIRISVVDGLDDDNDNDGYSPNQGDCDDTNSAVHPGADEVCGNDRDDDCNMIVDDRDGDADNHVDVACADTYDGNKPADDCNDDDSTIYPGAPETEDGVDNDCNGDIDDGTDAWDEDGDCVCVADTCTGSTNAACLTVVGGDCDDDDAANFPGNPEVCDGADNDCSEVPDDGLTFVDYVADVDQDGFGDLYGKPVSTCSGAPLGYVEDATDCNDADYAVNPAAAEATCDGVDNDCDIATLDGPDGDGDGVPECIDCDDDDPANFPGNPELCDGLDND